MIRLTTLFLWLLLTPALMGCLSTPWLSPRPAAPRPKVEAQFRAPVAAGQLVIHADFHLPPGHRMVSELTSERQLICDSLNVPAGDEPIHVYLFANEATYRAHVSARYPNFPERRAIFVETDVTLSVYAHWSDRVAEDLRHEVSHGYLHSSVPNLPLWLDEGLAEYFEVARGRQGVNRPHVDQLLSQLDAGTWRPDLSRLEALADAAAMTQRDYAEAWLWVHFLLTSPSGSPAVITEYLGSLRRGEPAASLHAKLPGRLPTAEDVNAAVVAHLRTLAL